LSPSPSPPPFWGIPDDGALAVDEDFPPPVLPPFWEVVDGAWAVDAWGWVLADWPELIPPLCPDVPPQAAAAIATPSTTISNVLRMSSPFLV
jgi:hypothetical protein